MKAETAAFLRDLNLRFYREQAHSFAETRRRIQPGVARLLARLPDQGAWLDIGCGSGWLAVEWLRKGRSAAYLGLDFSAELLETARAQLAAEGGGETERTRFTLADLAQSGWSAGLEREGFEGGLCFAVLHHLAGAETRLDFVREAAGLIRPGGMLAVSVWQFQNSPKLLRRVVAWEQAGLEPSAVEDGDTLLDWRHPQGSQCTYRYVHLFKKNELSALAEDGGFGVEETFASDGEGGQLGLYQVWRRK